MSSPSATLGSNCLFCSSLPYRRTASPEQTVGMKGPGTRALPISSIINTRSRKLLPAPPNSSGRISPIHPNCAILRHSSAEYPSSLCSDSLTRLMGHSSCKKSLATFRSISCSSEKTSSMVSSPSDSSRPGQAQSSLGHNIPHNFGGTPDNQGLKGVSVSPLEFAI